MATEIGTVIDDKYEILKQIGQGGMSVVYLAMDKRLNKQWAVKEIKKQANGKNDEVIISSLLAEANLMKRLDHPALPRIVDIIDNWQTIYVIMDYIEGESLDKILQEYGAQPQELVLEWGKQLCDALQYLHSQKPPIIYRDMKPANIMLKPEGNLKVIDFGIAREYKEKNLADTTVLGTRGYAPPEQHGSRQTDARSDIYALGMTMHHLLTGADPRPADYMYVPIRQWNHELSGGLERIIDKCTALDPEDRYQNCNELMYALEHYEEEDSVYRKSQQKKLTKFIVSAGLSVVMALTGIGGQFFSSFANKQDYNNLISFESSTPYAQKEEDCLKAIDLIGTDERAYIKLLDTYIENNSFGVRESEKITLRFNNNKAGFDQESDEYLELLYEMGVTHFYYLKNNDGILDSTCSDRAKQAIDYFKGIVDSGRKDFKFYDMAESYYTICEFYYKYIDTNLIIEPTKEVYEKFISAVAKCIDSVDTYEEEDDLYVRLNMYSSVVNLLNDQCENFADTQVDKTVVVNLLAKIKEKAEKTHPIQKKSQEIREKLSAFLQRTTVDMVRICLSHREKIIKSLQEGYLVR